MDELIFSHFIALIPYVTFFIVDLFFILLFTNAAVA